jgi:large exoprotein involved in heme utilization and adhesion
MNRIHRKIWNSKLGSFIAVAGITKGRGKSSGVSSALLASVLMASGAAHAQALPSGAQVTAGQASIGTAGAVMNIDQSSQRAAINWQSFNIGAGGTVSVPRTHLPAPV